MDAKTLERAIKIKEEIELLNAEIDILPRTDYKRRLRWFRGEKLKKTYKGLYAVETYTVNKEVIPLNQQDIEALIEIRRKRIEALEEELKGL